MQNYPSALRDYLHLVKCGEVWKFMTQVYVTIIRVHAKKVEFGHSDSRKKRWLSSKWNKGQGQLSQKEQIFNCIILHKAFPIYQTSNQSQAQMGNYKRRFFSFKKNNIRTCTCRSWRLWGRKQSWQRRRPPKRRLRQRRLRNRRRIWGRSSSNPGLVDK